MNRKNGSEAAVDISDKNNGDVDIVFITQVAAISCAETQHPEITLASQSLRKTEFRSANHVDVVLILVASEMISPHEQLNRPVPKLLDEIFFFDRLEEAGLAARKAAWKAFSLHRSQIFRESVSDAGSDSGILRLTGPFRCFSELCLRDSGFLRNQN